MWGEITLEGKVHAAHIHSLTHTQIQTQGPPTIDAVTTSTIVEKYKLLSDIGKVTNPTTAAISQAAAGARKTASVSSKEAAQHPPVPRFKKERRKTAQLVRQLSEESIKPPMAPEHVVVEVKSEETGEFVRKIIYVTDVNGTKTLDLYSGWNPESQQHKLPIKELPPKVCQIVTLERLWVSHNKLSSLPVQIEQMFRLREVYLHKNNFEEIPTSLCSLPSLEILWLNCNKIKKIPPEIASLKTLRRLHLDTNFIKELPDSLCLLDSLEVLYLNENTIHTISENVGAMKGLKRLYLHRNKITDIPSGLCSLRNIRILNLDDNEIRHVRREFQIYQQEMEATKATISTKNNPFVTPGSKMKLSFSGMHPPHYGSKTRRFSDQYEHTVAARRPLRVSLPGRSADSYPDQMNVVLSVREPTAYKADTLPRCSTVSVMARGRVHEQ